MKREMLMRKVGASLKPDGDASWDVFDTIRSSKSVVVTVRQPRNPDHLKKYWAVATAVADAYDGFEDKDDADHYVRINIPWMRKEYRLRDDRLAIRPLSIGIESMDQLTFNDFYDRALKLWAELIGMDPEDLRREGREREQHRHAA